MGPVNRSKQVACGMSTDNAVVVADRVPYDRTVGVAPVAGGGAAPPDRDWTSLARPHPSARHDAPLIGERGATRGRGATEGGDERGGVKRGSFEPQPRETESSGGKIDCPEAGGAFRARTRPPS
jgi:hypothetical protein